MRSLTPLLLFFVLPLGVLAQPNVYIADIDHFWEAYDSVRNTTDTALQVQLIQLSPSWLRAQPTKGPI